MKQLSIYDPAAGCLTGACGPQQVQELADFENALSYLTAMGVTVDRFNLGYDPEEFSSNALVKAIIRAQGVTGLPVVLVDGEVLTNSRYPTSEELGI